MFKKHKIHIRVLILIVKLKSLVYNIYHETLEIDVRVLAGMLVSVINDLGKLGNVMP